MRIFLSYPSEIKSTAEPIAYSLRSRGHKVFLDKDDLPPGRSYDDQIQHAIEQSDLLIYLICPASVQKGRYTLTEMEFARAAWTHPANRVLPVIVEPTDMSKIPSFLKGVTILEPQGNITAEVAAAAERLRGNDFAFKEVTKGAALCAGSVAVLMLLLFLTVIWSGPRKSVEFMAFSTILGLPICLLTMLQGRHFSWRTFLPLATMGVAYSLASPFFLGGGNVKLADTIATERLFNKFPSQQVQTGQPESTEEPETDPDRDDLFKQIGSLNAWVRMANDTAGWMIAGTILMIGVLVGTSPSTPSLNNVKRWMIATGFGAAAMPIAGKIGESVFAALPAGFDLKIAAAFAVGFAAYYIVVGGVLSYWIARGQAT